MHKEVTAKITLFVTSMNGTFATAHDMVEYYQEVCSDAIVRGFVDETVRAPWKLIEQSPLNQQRSTRAELEDTIPALKANADKEYALELVGQLQAVAPHVDIDRLIGEITGAA